MARHRTRVRISRTLRAVAVAVAAAGTVTALFEADIGRDILLSSSTVALAPPALYIVLAFVLLRGAPLSRRLGWAVAACGVNALLALLSGVTLSVTHPMSFEGAMRRALWAFAPGPLVLRTESECFPFRPHSQFRRPAHLRHRHSRRLSSGRRSLLAVAASCRR